MPGIIGNMEQERAKFAYEKATIQERNKDDKYSSYLRNLPMMIKTNGLGAALAFVLCKKNKEPAYGWIYEDISGWLIKLEILGEGKELIEDIISRDSQPYRRITIEVLSFLKWLKRFAESFAPGKEQKTADES